MFPSSSSSLAQVSSGSASSLSPGLPLVLGPGPLCPAPGLEDEELDPAARLEDEELGPAPQSVDAELGPGLGEGGAAVAAPGEAVDGAGLSHMKICLAPPLAAGVEEKHTVLRGDLGLSLCSNSCASVLFSSASSLALSLSLLLKPFCNKDWLLLR